MTLSENTLDHLLEVQSHLRAAIKSAAVNENPLVVNQISKLLLDVEHIKDFDRILIVDERRKTVAKHLIDFLEKNGRYNKTILFCQNSEHAAAMTKLLRNYSGEAYDYAVRIVSAEGETGLQHLDKFQEPNQEIKLKLNFLHIGVGNSEMAQKLSRYLTHIDGITIAGKEVIHSEKVSKANNITNYKRLSI